MGRASKAPSANELKKQAAIDAKFRKKADSKLDEEDDDFDYTDDEDGEDSDYENESKPWMKKKMTTRRSGLDNSSDEDDYDDGKGSNKRSFVEADLEDFRKVTIPRRRLARWCNEPYFEDAVVNSYVRLAIGRDGKTQKPCYRLCKITGVQQNKEYQFPAYTGQKPVSFIYHFYFFCWNLYPL